MAAASPPRTSAARWVLWCGIALGTALAALALTDGVRLHVSHSLPSWLSAVLGALVLWAMIVAAATVMAELTRRHGKTAARSAAVMAGRGGKRAAGAGGRLASHHARRGAGWLAERAGSRWEDRTRTADERQFANPSVTDLLTALRDRRQRLYRRHTGGDETGPEDASIVPGLGSSQDTTPASAGDATVSAVIPPLAALARPVTRRADGQPETPADTRFFDLRESGYTGPVDEDGNAAALTVSGAGQNALATGLVSAVPVPGARPGDTLTPALEQQIKRQVCDWYAADGMRPDEVRVHPDGWITVDRRATYPDAQAVTGLRWDLRPVYPATATASSSTEGTLMSETSTLSGSAIPMSRTRRPARRPGTDAGGAWKSLVSGTGDFEPEDDSHLLTWMAGETTGMSLYAEAITDVYETVVNTIGVDPVAMAALHDYADAAAEAAQAMAVARQKFAAHYAEIREFAASGGTLPYNGRWITGEGES